MEAPTGRDPGATDARAPAHVAGRAPIGAWCVLGIALVYAGLWVVATPYFGLNHDAQAYAASGLIAIDPQPLAGDLFFRYRSQDEFSVFPALYGQAIGALGLEPAAALLCGVLQFAWFALAAAIAATLLGPRVGMLALGLLVVLPEPYGGQRVFHLVEPFLTPRLPAEVLSLLAFWLYLKGRRVGSAIAVCVAATVHPLIAFPALLLLVFLEVRRRIPPAAAAAGFTVIVVCGAILASWLLGGDSPVMEGQWLAVTRIRSPFLFLDGWRPVDWSNLLQCVLVLALCARVMRGSESASVASATLWLAAAGLTLAAVTTFIAPLDLLVQGQPWRWLWVARLFATMLLPGLLFALWSGPSVERAAALFVAAGSLLFVDRANPSALAQMSPSILTAFGAALWAWREPLAPSGRSALGAAYAALVAVVGASLLRATGAVGLVLGSPAPHLWFAILRAVGSATVPLVIVAVGAWALCLRTAGAVSRGLLLVAGCAFLVAVGPRAQAEWSAQRFPERARAQFTDWRQRIPAHAEVLWLGDRLQETWFLLGRQSYLSRSQSGGVVFSRDLAGEVVRRALVLAPLIEPGYWIADPAAANARAQPLTRATLAEVCRDPELGFVVAGEDVGGAAARKDWPVRGAAIFLYACDDVRRRAP